MTVAGGAERFVNMAETVSPGSRRALWGNAGRGDTSSRMGRWTDAPGLDTGRALPGRTDAAPADRRDRAAPARHPGRSGHDARGRRPARNGSPRLHGAARADH